MNYRIADKGDKSALFSLWRSCFGDEDGVIERFFDTVIEFDNTAVAEDEDGGIVSALYLIPAVIRCGGEDFNAYYVYAAATDARFRRRGIMKNLLSFAGETAYGRGADYLFLRPGGEKLYGYYADNGFVTAFYEQKRAVAPDGVPELFDFVVWDEKVIKLDSELNGGMGFFGKNGYACLDGEGSLSVEYFVSESPK